VAIWYNFPHFGILCQEKSGNPDEETNSGRPWRSGAMVMASGPVYCSAVDFYWCWWMAFNENYNEIYLYNPEIPLNQRMHL
jgi:hypothetical protein